MKQNINAWDIYVYILDLAYTEKIEEKTYLWCQHLLTYFYYEFKDNIFKKDVVYLDRIGVRYLSIDTELKNHSAVLNDKINYEIIKANKNVIKELDIKIKDRINRLFYKLRNKKCFELSMGIHRRHGYWYANMKKYIVKCRWDEDTFNKDTNNGKKYIKINYKLFINHKEKLRCV